MAWSQFSIDKPHWAYLIIGGFTSLFMLCSLIVKEKLYIGEATVATIVGVIFGPFAANLFNPLEWGNTDEITLECSRIVLVVQCFAVGVELPKAYMERHWKSVAFMLGPVMTFGWLITSLFIWWMIKPLTWLESLAVAACVTATDPVLASSVVGKGKFAKRVPKHLRDVLSAESGCNDGMAFPFIYLSVYLIQYHLGAQEVTLHWFCLTILYECILGAIYGVLVGYIARHLIRFADSRGLIDRESFLAFYFVLALFCAGSAATLGLDDLLVGFAAGVGFSNDGWFTAKTEEAHVSNVIDLLLNLAYFVYLGSVIPWTSFNAPDLGLEPWRLVVIAIFVLLFRRIPIVVALKPFIPDIKNWREALFAGHFGPIGVGAIFAAILARAELENDSTQPDADLPGPDEPNYLIVQLIWPIVSFLVICSIVVHGSSIAVFTLGKRINTLTLTMSYTQANEPTWMNRLPRIASVSKSMSRGKGDDYDSSDERLPQFPPGTLGPVGVPGNFLRRQRDEDTPGGSRTSSIRPTRRKKWDSGRGPGGPISQSAIAPQRRNEPVSPLTDSPPDDEELVDEKSERDKTSRPASQDDSNSPTNDSPSKSRDKRAPDVEAFEEGHDLVVEDEEGNVVLEHDVEGMDSEQKQEIIEEAKLKIEHSHGEFAEHKHEAHERDEGSEIEEAIAAGITHPRHPYKNFRQMLGEWNHRRHQNKAPADASKTPRRGAANAYQYGNTIIVEDEDGEVIKKYDIPAAARVKNRPGGNEAPLSRFTLRRMGTRTGDISNPEAGNTEDASAANADAADERKAEYDDDEQIRFTVGGESQRIGKADFIRRIQSLDPKAQADAIKDTQTSSSTKRQMQDAASQQQAESSTHRRRDLGRGRAEIRPSAANTDERLGDDRPSTANSAASASDGASMHLVTSEGQQIPIHPVGDTVSRLTAHMPETAAQRRRRQAAERHATGVDPAAPKAAASARAGRRALFAASGSGSNSGSGSGVGSSSSTAAGSSSRDARGHDARHSPNSHLSPRSHGGANSSDNAGGRGQDGEGTGRIRSNTDEGETAAERRRRLAALGQAGSDQDTDSDEDGGERLPQRGHRPTQEPGSSLSKVTSKQGQTSPSRAAAAASGSAPQTGSGSGFGSANQTGSAKKPESAGPSSPPPSRGIRFADSPAASSSSRVQWSTAVADRLKRKT